MPKIVDHDARRQQVVDLTRELIRRDGIHAVTMRDIAEAAGSSTAIISHYFKDKSDLLLHAYRQSLDAARERRRRIKETGLAGLARYCEALLPLDEVSRETWRLSIAFAAMGVTDERFAAEYRINVLLAREQVRSRLQSLAQADGLHSKIDLEELARAILVAVQGMGLEALLNASDWPPGRQKEAVGELLAWVTQQPLQDRRSGRPFSS